MTFWKVKIQHLCPSTTLPKPVFPGFPWLWSPDLPDRPQCCRTTSRSSTVLLTEKPQAPEKVPEREQTFSKYQFRELTLKFCSFYSTHLEPFHPHSSKYANCVHLPKSRSKTTSAVKCTLTSKYLSRPRICHCLSLDKFPEGRNHHLFLLA